MRKYSNSDPCMCISAAVCACQVYHKKQQAADKAGVPLSNNPPTTIHHRTTKTSQKALANGPSVTVTKTKTKIKRKLPERKQSKVSKKQNNNADTDIDASSDTVMRDEGSEEQEQTEDHHDEYNDSSSTNSAPPLSSASSVTSNHSSNSSSSAKHSNNKQISGIPPPHPTNANKHGHGYGCQCVKCYHPTPPHITHIAGGSFDRQFGNFVPSPSRSPSPSEIGSYTSTIYDHHNNHHHNTGGGFYPPHDHPHYPPPPPPPQPAFSSPYAHHVPLQPPIAIPRSSLHAQAASDDAISTQLFLYQQLANAQSEADRARSYQRGATDERLCNSIQYQARCMSAAPAPITFQQPYYTPHPATPPPRASTYIYPSVPQAYSYPPTVSTHAHPHTAFTPLTHQPHHPQPQQQQQQQH